MQASPHKAEQRIKNTYIRKDKDNQRGKDNRYFMKE